MGEMEGIEKIEKVSEGEMMRIEKGKEEIIEEEKVGRI